LGPARALRLAARGLEIDRAAAAFSEPLVLAKDFGVGGRNHYAHARNPPYWAAAPGAHAELRLRRGAAERLREVNSRLAEGGLRLFLFDAWRPRAVQAYFHDVWAPREIGRRRLDLTGAALAEEVELYWAAPSADADHPAPHATGGAVDLTLVWGEDGAPLFMGSLFDDPSVVSHTDHFEGREGLSVSEEEARANRRVLYWAMVDAGFANHPNEWWHFSYGDQMWAALTGARNALYGLAAPE
jgi:D-alanyl-D-alanine dipeptidase